MGRRKGYEQPPAYPLAESIESAAALVHLFGSRYEQGHPPSAEDYYRLNRALWSVAEELRRDERARREQMKAAPPRQEQEAAFKLTG
jgi:hypothetical protein